MDLIPRKFYLDDIFSDLVSKQDNMKCDVFELGDNYHIEMDIPGFDKKDVTIEVKNNYLTVTAEKNYDNEDNNKNYIRRERSYGKYERSFYLGDLDEENIEAEFKDGMLKIVIPKIEETKNKKFIEIK